MNVSQLSSIREKVTWKTLVVIGLYVAAAVVFVGFYLPAKSQIAFENQLEQMNQREEMWLDRGAKSGLQAQLQNRANLQVSRQFPRYDLAGSVL